MYIKKLFKVFKNEIAVIFEKVKIILENAGKVVINRTVYKI